MESLPNDVATFLLANSADLSVDDVLHACTTNRQMSRICKEPYIWQQIYIRQFGQNMYDQEAMVLMNHEWFKQLDLTKAWKFILMATRFYYKIGEPMKDAQWNHRKLNTHIYQLSRESDFAPRGGSFYFHGWADATGWLYKQGNSEPHTAFLKAIDSVTSEIAERRSYPTEEHWVIKDIHKVSNFTMKMTHLSVLAVCFYYNYYRRGPSNPRKLVGCNVCGKNASNVCGNCRSTSYCSKQCQNKDWKNHSIECKSE